MPKRIKHIIKIMIILCIAGIVIWSILEYRSSTRDVLKVSVDGVAIEKIDHLRDGGALDASKSNEVLKNPNDYQYVVYSFTFSNTSDIYKVIDLDIQTNYQGKMNDNVFWDQGPDFLVDHQGVGKGISVDYVTTVWVKRNGYSDEQLLQMVRKATFEIDYKTIRNDALLSIGVHHKIVKYDE